ncbi:MAG: hypothetical protein J6Q13_00945 [Clostridia bacterium]|nr:hypothetical protein [Clostridia bacterium]
MENSKPYSDEDGKLIDGYINLLKAYKENELCSSLVYFLSQYSSSSKSIINKRKSFLLKVLRECTNEFWFFDIKSFPREIGSKIITAYQEEIKKQDKEKQAHIDELVKEMNGLF